MCDLTEDKVEETTGYSLAEDLNDFRVERLSKTGFLTEFLSFLKIKRGMITAASRDSELFFETEQEALQFLGTTFSADDFHKALGTEVPIMDGVTVFRYKTDLRATLRFLRLRFKGLKNKT